MRFFNTTGPVHPGKHYSIPPLERLDLDDVLDLVRNERYFVLHRIRSSAQQEAIAGGSAFNIKARSMRLGDFTREDVLALLGQHTEETGQAFTPPALEMIWTRTQGQPWLVNALSDETCFRREAGRDRRRAIDEGDVREAEEGALRHEGGRYHVSLPISRCASAASGTQGNVARLCARQLDRSGRAQHRGRLCAHSVGALILCRLGPDQPDGFTFTPTYAALRQAQPAPVR